MIIGNFEYDAESDTYTGHVTTLTFHRSNVELKPNDKASAKEPDYRIVAQTSSLNVEFGAAWKRTSEKGQAFLSVSFDDPALPRALNAALFTDEGGMIATLVWSRPKSKATAKV